MAFTYRPALDEWNAWFRAWRHLTTVAFICEDFPWWETEYTERTTALIAAQQTIHAWLEGSSLDRFEVWSGVDAVELSRDFRLVRTRAHRLKWFDNTHAIFGRAKFGKEWGVLQVQPPRSAILAMKLNICEEKCWMCHVLCTSESPSVVRTNLASARWNRIPIPRQGFNYVPICTSI